MKMWEKIYIEQELQGFYFAPANIDIVKKDSYFEFLRITQLLCARFIRSSFRCRSFGNSLALELGWETWFSWSFNLMRGYS